VHLAVAGEDVAADVPAVLAVDEVGRLVEARRVGVRRDRVEVVLDAEAVELLDELVVVAGRGARDDDVAGWTALIAAVGGLDHPGVLLRVLRAAPERRGVLLVPQLPGVDARDALGELAHRAAEVGRVGRRGGAALAARRPGRRALHDHQDLQAPRLRGVRAGVHVVDDVRPELALGGLCRLPVRPQAHPAGAEPCGGLGGRLGRVDGLVDAGLKRRGGPGEAEHGGGAERHG
jgi:hypothetical protein